MIEVYHRLFVGGVDDCSRVVTEGRAIVHACKHPCHQRAVGYRGVLPKTHPEYLARVENCNLYLNVVDAPVPLFLPATFRLFRSFARAAWEGEQEVLIHCNEGRSRAPSLALLFLAKDLHVLPEETFQEAAEAFLTLYPAYAPGRGIAMYLETNWGTL